MTTLNHDDILSFIETQLSVWTLAKQNYDALAKVERRNIEIGNLECGIQWNPARIRSTGAKIDKDSIRSRKCFLCRDNRPKEQLIYDIASGWEMLVNPFPILPVHLTIASTSHIPQSRVPEDIVTIAETLPGMAVFFNGARAGASAPDHLHLQAVLKDELPLLRLAEKLHDSKKSGIMTSAQTDLDLPFFFISGIVTPDSEGMKCLRAGFAYCGLFDEDISERRELVNVFFWIDDSVRLRYVVIPRKTHRPECFYSTDSSYRMVSPGCIDMTGLIITPREEDFRTLSEKEIRKIYSDVAFPKDYE